MFVIVWEAAGRRWFWDGRYWNEMPGAALVYEARAGAEREFARMRALRVNGGKCLARIKRLEAGSCK